MKNHLPFSLLGLVVSTLAISGIAPYDRATWIMEVLPVLIALPLLAATRRSYPLTTLLYVLIAAHALVLIAGGARGGSANLDTRLSDISASMGDGNRLPRSRSNEKTPS